MFQIVKKRFLNETVCEMMIKAPLVAKKAQAGEFIILRTDEDGERIPLTVAGFDRKKGLVRIIFQIVGATTMKLGHKNEGEYISDFVGPLGKETEIAGVKNACVVGGGVGSAIALPLAQRLFSEGAKVTTITGFRTKDLIILQDEFKKSSHNHILTTDDGSAGFNGNVCMPLEELLSGGEKYDKIFAIGPLIMMKFVVQTAKKYNIPCVVSMNPIMIDGTGMCGCCRLTVGGETKFACVDGPDFDGYEVDFDEALFRGGMYREEEQKKREETCNLFKKEVK